MRVGTAQALHAVGRLGSSNVMTTCALTFLSSHSIDDLYSGANVSRARSPSQLAAAWMRAPVGRARVRALLAGGAAAGEAIAS